MSASIGEQVDVVHSFGRTAWLNPGLHCGKALVLTLRVVFSAKLETL